MPQTPEQLEASLSADPARPKINKTIYRTIRCFWCRNPNPSNCIWNRTQ